MPQSVSSSNGRAIRVVVDGRELTGNGRFGGLGSFTRSLLASLAADSTLRVRALTTDTGTVPAGVEPVRILRRFDERRRSVYEHEALVSLDVARTGGDVVFSPVIHGVPWTRKPYVQTLHDVIPLVLPNADLAYLRKWWRRWARAYRRADAVVAVSRHSADEGIRVLGLAPDRVHVAYNGVSPKFTPRPSGEPDEPPYLLVVSDYQPRKGLRDTVAVAGALADLGYPHTLKIAGRVQPQFENEVDEIVATAPRPDRVERLGFVDDLVELYRGASLFVWCSRYEGFGLPVAEAMACGVPVVSYANSSLPEIVGDGGILVPDGDVEAMVGAARSLLDDRARWEELREAGIERAGEFTWDKSASVYEEIFRGLAAR